MTAGGFGPSSKPGTGYNYDTLAADLDALLKALDLTDVSLVGHSMGIGEITRYIGTYGTERLKKAVPIGTIGPYLVKTPDNPEGRIRHECQLGGRNWCFAHWHRRLRRCVDQDFHTDIPRNDIPTMISHGDDDSILPADATSRRQTKMIKNVKFVELKGGSHGLT